MHIYLFYLWIPLDCYLNIEIQYWIIGIKNGVLDLVLFLANFESAGQYCTAILYYLYYKD